MVLIHFSPDDADVVGHSPKRPVGFYPTDRRGKGDFVLLVDAKVLQ